MTKTAPPKEVRINASVLQSLLVESLTPGLQAIGRREVQAIQAALSVPVGRSASGKVSERSAPGNPPRLEEGILHANVEWEITTEGGEWGLDIFASRPPEGMGDQADAAEILEYGGMGQKGYVEARPFMTPAGLRVEGYAAETLAKHAKD